MILELFRLKRKKKSVFNLGKPLYKQSFLGWINLCDTDWTARGSSKKKRGVQMFSKRLRGGLVLAGSLFLSCNPVFAGEIEDEITVLKSKIARLEQRLDEQAELTSGLEGTKEMLKGLSISAGATFIVQGTNNANGDDLSAKGEDVTDGSYSIDLEIEKTFDDYGMAFIHLETGDGASVEDELKVFSNVNRDADDSDNSLALTEVWYEHYFQALPLTLTLGKIDPTVYIDTNIYANDECRQFLGRSFRNSPTIEFCDNSGGLHLGLAPADFMELDLITLDADSDWEDMGDGVFFGAQLNFKPNLFKRGGNYRIVGWLDNRDHTRWKDSAKSKEEGYGVGVSFDQELSDSIGAFLRYGWQDPDVYLNGESFSLEHAWSTGIQLTGTGWGRKDDVLGLAVGQVIPSDQYKKAGTNLEAADEGHFEAYYNYKVNEHLTLTPDVQLIWNPYGDDAANGNSTVTVVGMRGQVDF